VALVPRFLTLTAAPVTTAPDWSVTLPAMEPDSACPKAKCEQIENNNKRGNALAVNLIFIAIVHTGNRAVRPAGGDEWKKRVGAYLHKYTDFGARTQMQPFASVSPLR
jgi:hypothetical protein